MSKSVNKSLSESVLDQSSNQESALDQSVPVRTTDHSKTETTLDKSKTNDSYNDSEFENSVSDKMSSTARSMTPQLAADLEPIEPIQGTREANLEHKLIHELNSIPLF